MRKAFLLLLLLLLATQAAFCWGFYAHQKINYYAVFLLPPQMLLFYKQNIQFISEHATDPDKRRYAVAEESLRLPRRGQEPEGTRLLRRAGKRGDNPSGDLMPNAASMPVVEDAACFYRGMSEHATIAGLSGLGFLSAARFVAVAMLLECNNRGSYP